MPTNELDDYLNSLEADEGTAPVAAPQSSNSSALPDWLERPEDDELRGYLDALPEDETTPMSAQPRPQPPALEAVGAGLLRGGVRDPLDTVLGVLDYPAAALERQFGTPVGPTVAEAADTRAQARQQFTEEYGQSPYATGGRVAGNVAATVFPLLRGAKAIQGTAGIGQGLEALRGAGTGGKVLANALTGAGAGAGEAALVAGGYDDPAMQQITSGTFLGAALGPVAPLVGNVIGRAYQGAKGKVNALLSTPPTPTRVEPTMAPTTNAVTDDPAVAEALANVGLDPTQLNPTVANNLLQAGQEQAKNGLGQLDADQLARAANFEALGLQPTRGIVTRDPLQFAREDELAKTPEGAALLAVKLSNNQMLRSHLDTLAENTGGSVASPYEAGKAVFDASNAKYDELQGYVSQLYKDVADTYGGKFAVVPSRLAGMLDGQGPNGDEYLLALAAEGSERFMGAVRSKLKGLGIIDSDGDLVTTQAGNNVAMNIKEAEALRKFIRSIETKSPTLTAYKESLVNAFDDDVIEETGDDVFRQARDAARERFTEFGVGRKAKDNRSAAILKAIVENQATPDNLVQNFIMAKNVPVEAVVGLKQSLTTSSAPQATLQILRGEQAWNDVRRSVADELVRAATGKNIGEGFVSYTGMRNFMEKLGREKLQIIFGEEGERKLRQVLSAARDLNYAPPGSPINTSNTANELMNRLVEMSKKGESLGNVLGLGGAAAGEPSALLANVAGTVMRGAAEKSASKANKTGVANALTPVWQKAVKEPESLLNPQNQLGNALIIPGAVSASNPQNRSQ